jgi:small GTP-binding protein
MVGKTSLMYRYVNNKFSEKYIASLGAQFLTKEIRIKAKNNHKDKIKLIIWDIMGQSNPAFEDLRTTFYRGADGAILIFDLTRKDSLRKLTEWHSQVTKMLGRDLPVLLIGNKIDLLKNTESIPLRKEAIEFAESIHCDYIETSAKTGENVDIAFSNLAFKLVKKSGHDVENHEIYQDSGSQADGLEFIVKSRIKDYINSQGLRASRSIFKSFILNEQIREILDKAIVRAKANNRKTLKERDL